MFGVWCDDSGAAVVAEQPRPFLRPIRDHSTANALHVAKSTLVAQAVAQAKVDTNNAVQRMQPVGFSYTNS